MAQKIDWDIVVVGGINTDYLMRGARLPKPGESVQGDEFKVAPGGKGANQAVAAARLGAKVALVARVGSDDRGIALLENLAAEGVDTRYIIRDPDAPTGVAVIQINDQGEKQTFSTPGASRRLTTMDVQAAASAITATKVFLVQLKVRLDVLTVAVHLAREAGAKVVLDPAPAVPLPDEVLQMVDVIKPNASEAQVLTGVQVRDRASARQAAQQLLQRGVGAVAVQAGDEGNFLVWSQGEYWLPKLPVNSIDATGAGDAFAAAMAVALAEDKSLIEAGSFASAAAAIATTALGAQTAFPRRDEIQLLLAQVGCRQQTHSTQEAAKR